MQPAQAIAAFLTQPAIAVVGASRTGHKFGNTACHTLRDKGYRVYLIHPSAAKIDGMTCYRRISDVPEKVNAVLIVVPPWEALDVLSDAAADGVRYAWLQQGAESAEAVALAAKLGMEIVAGECILMFAKPSGIHNLHRWCRRVTGSLPA